MTTEWKDITDPEELFRLKREGWEIEWSNFGRSWSVWPGEAWASRYQFRGRPRQPKTKKVKLLCFFSPSGIRYDLLENGEQHRLLKTARGWIRVPSEDREVEVPE